MKPIEVTPAGTTGWNTVELPSGEHFEHYAVQNVDQYTGDDHSELLATYYRVGKLWFQKAEPLNAEVTSTRLIEKLNAVVAASRKYSES